MYRRVSVAVAVAVELRLLVYACTYILLYMCPHPTVCILIRLQLGLHACQCVISLQRAGGTVGAGASQVQRSLWSYGCWCMSAHIYFYICVLIQQRSLCTLDS